MAITVGTVIRGARNRHPSFTPNRHPDRLLREGLSTVNRRLHGEALRVAPEATIVETVTTLPLVDFSAGITLPAHRRVLSVVASDPQSTASEPRATPIRLIDPAMRTAPNRPPRSAWVANGKLYLDNDAAYWTGYRDIVVATAATPADLTTDAAVFALSDTADGLLIAEGALIMARRSKQGDGVDRAEFQRERDEAFEAWLADLGLSTGGEIYTFDDR